MLATITAGVMLFNSVPLVQRDIMVELKTKENRAFLRGLSSINVSVDNKEQRELIELRMRTLGIKILEDKQNNFPKLIFYSNERTCEMYVLETVRLTRDPAHIFSIETWRAFHTETEKNPNLRIRIVNIKEEWEVNSKADIKNAINECLTQFSNDYLAANPKK